MSQELIRKIIPFTKSDLEANRRFQVTDAQLKRLRSEINYFYKLAIWGIIITLIIICIVALTVDLPAINPRRQKNPDEPNLLLPFIGLIIFFFLAHLLLFLWCLLQFRKYKSKLTVLVTEGKVERSFDEHYYTVKIGDVEFYVDKAKHDAFTGEYYRVYYLDSKDILSVELPETKI